MFKNKLRRIYKDLGQNIRIVFRSHRVGTSFSLKSRTPLGLKANVVYRYHCSCDENMSYIGKTKRHLATRSREHLTGSTAVTQHLRTCQACKDNASLNNFTVIASGRTDFEIKIKEALFIKYEKPRINNQLFQQGSSFFLNVFN